MRGKKAFKYGRAVPMLLAGFLGYALGGWNAPALRDTALSAAQTVALRFPQDWGDAADVTATPAAMRSAAVLNGSQLALLSPEPMIPRTTNPQSAIPQAATPETSVPQAVLQTAAVEDATPSRSFDEKPRSQSKPAVMQAAPIHRREDRPGFILNDAQIASIKDRLHLTPDQEEMWPAVEAALRNIAYTRAREAHRRGEPASAAQLASADPNSIEVQGLKSAAIPLIMSFNSEQKDEVRGLAHVMGLDQLAAQF